MNDIHRMNVLQCEQEVIYNIHCLWIVTIRGG